MFLLLFYYSCPNFPPPSPTHHSHSQSPSYCPCPWVICTCALIRLFTIFSVLSPVLPSHRPCQFVPCFHSSGSVCCLFILLISSYYRWEHMSFATWFISLSIMLSSSIHAFMKAKSSFFLYAVYYSIAQMYPNFLIHLFTDGHLGCF